MTPFDSTKHYTWEQAMLVFGRAFVDMAILAGIRILKRPLTEAKVKLTNW